MRKRIPSLLILLVLILVSCNFPIRDLGFITHPYPTLDPAIFESRTTPTPGLLTPAPGSTSAPYPTPAVDGNLNQIYAAQSGDTLRVVARHFGVAPQEITSTGTIPETGIIPPGQLLVIPVNNANAQQRPLILPDSAVINSPCAQDFDTAGFVIEAGGYLSNFSQVVAGERISGAAVVQRVADNQSISPRLLLAFIEYRSGLVYGNTPPPDIYHPLEMNDPYFNGLYQELSLAARMLNGGYYGWRYGSMTSMTYPDELTLRIPANLNAGSVGMMNLFAHLYSSFEWEERMLGTEGFMQLYLSMFGDPMICASQVEPLLSEQVSAPALQLPFATGEVWAYTAGPHYSWVEGTPLGAIDFAPNIKDAGCLVSHLYARAVAAGTVTRADNGVIMLTLEDENSQPTGWEVLYLHIAAQDSARLGAHLAANDPVGHPSCEGGSATGTHVHIARKYKGEWIGTTDLFPFILDRWQVVPGDSIYTGYLVKDDLVVTARQGGGAESLITR